MLASIRPDSWNLPLFLHVLGATILVGAMASAALAARASSSPAIPRALPFRILVLLAIPSWLLMRVAGQWIESKEDVPGDPTWLGVGFMVGDIGLVVLLVAAGFAWWAAKQAGEAVAEVDDDGPLAALPRRARGRVVGHDRQTGRVSAYEILTSRAGFSLDTRNSVKTWPLPSDTT